MSLHHLLIKIKSEGLTTQRNGSDFVKFCSKEMAALNGCLAVNVETTKQSDCPLWHEVHYGRITASKIHDVAHCIMSDGVLLEMIVGAMKLPQTSNVSWNHSRKSSSTAA